MCDYAPGQARGSGGEGPAPPDGLPPACALTTTASLPLPGPLSHHE